MKNITEIGWEDLKCYRFDCYPDTLVVTTDAGPNAWEIAQKEFSQRQQEGNAENIENILQRLGFAAVCGQRMFDVAEVQTVTALRTALRNLLIETDQHAEGDCPKLLAVCEHARMLLTGRHPLVDWMDTDSAEQEEHAKQAKDLPAHKERMSAVDVAKLYAQRDRMHAALVNTYAAISRVEGSESEYRLLAPASTIAKIKAALALPERDGMALPDPCNTSEGTH